MEDKDEGEADLPVGTEFIVGACWLGVGGFGVSPGLVVVLLVLVLVLVLLVVVGRWRLSCRT